MNARRASATAAGLLLGMALATAALAQKQGGILRVQHRDSPASMSILEEGTISAIMPVMGVFNNLVLRSACAAEPGGIDNIH
jgi:peptide/nickel transport system substrate-binding protein